MSDFEYDYQRFDEILSKLVRDHCEVEDDPDFLQIGENISSIPAIKVIFDGFGLAEELYYNERSFQLQDDVVMVQNDSWEWEELSEDDEDYEYVQEKLELFEQYRNGDGPCNPDMQSFAVFIHKDAINDGFEFPEHEFTPWGLMHRTKEEVCVYVWWNREDDTMDILQLEDRLDEDSPFDEEGVMAILEKIAADNGFDVEQDNTVKWPFSRPEEGESKLNANAAWPFATGPKTVGDEEAEVYEQHGLINDPAVYAPGDLIRIEERDGKRYEIRQPSAEFSASFPGVLEVIEIKDPNEPKQDYRAILESVVTKRGLPKEVGAKGWITETREYWRDDVHVSNVEEGLKGWLFVDRDDNGDGEPSYNNVDELIEVCRAMVEDNNDDETSLVVNVVNPAPDAEDIRHVTINNEEADGKSWEHDIIMDEDEFYEMVKSVLIENGELDEEEAEDMDNDDLDVNGFYWDHCQDQNGEVRYSYGYGVAYMEFDDGFKVGMTMKDGDLYIHYYDGKDVDKNTVFE